MSEEIQVIAETGLTKPSEIRSVQLSEETDVVKIYQKMAIVNKAIYSTPTPRNAVMSREGAGGQSFDYIIDDYFKRMLDAITPVWSFITKPDSPKMHTFEKQRETVKGLILTEYSYFFVASGEIHLQFHSGVERRISDTGTAEVMVTKEKGKFLVDTAAKSATTDCFKRCCARLGLAADIYGRALASEYHKLAFAYLIQKFEHSNENTKKLKRNFEESVYATQQEKIIGFVKNLVIPDTTGKYNFGFPKEMATDYFKNMSIYELINMVLDKMEEDVQKNLNSEKLTR